ncbi:hypothetical protein MCOR27_007082 [Pyricularia oryzae]|uniref:Uncharacterized protein n=2 Tax=Pyricularia TaxID=48558 RepID=A0ABQ8NQC5_PYRGI|nr:hypothetical protein MCOR19_006864 [Pyricularia oryzae]KAI6300039.1 hypothetical protein MCOR33_004149 [Pyricularia grisea]KAI6267700.1 hypothetical protein MCOR26_009576 [Pyricularia oryzae]KAI6275223.1 hypothetical protein MCOR27_007082 [Pyricularia oryzae]KAI6319236.1 hypothetical protein MCOR29_005666 [Pyricularia oryzae]
MATARSRICHICSATTCSRNFCHSCGHALCPTCVCKIPADAADTHKAFVSNDYSHPAMEGGVKYISHDRTPPGEPTAVEYASTARSILASAEDLRSRNPAGGGERLAPKFYFLPWFNPTKQLSGSVSNNPFILADQKKARLSAQVESTPDISERAADSESRHMSRWHGTDAEPLAETLRKYQHRHEEKHKVEDDDQGRWLFTPETIEIRSKLSPPIHPKAPAQTMRPRHEEWGYIQGAGEENIPGSSGILTEPGLIRRPDSEQSPEMLLRKTSRGFVPVDSRSQSYCSVDEQPLLEDEASADHKPENEMVLPEKVDSPVRGVDVTSVINSNTALTWLQSGNDHTTDPSPVESFTTAFQIHPNPRFLGKRHSPASSETRIRREVDSISMRRRSKGPGHPETSLAPSIGVRSRQDTQATVRIASKGRDTLESYGAEPSLVSAQMDRKQRLQQAREQIYALDQSFQELQRAIELRGKEASRGYDEISDESGRQASGKTPERERLMPAALNSGFGRGRQHLTPEIEPEQRSAAIEKDSDEKVRFEKQLEAIRRQQQHHTMDKATAVGDEIDDAYYDDNHECIWKARYLALSTEVHQLREMMSERQSLSSASARAVASGIEDTDSNFGLEGLTIVMHLKGKDDLVINTDLRER